MTCDLTDKIFTDETTARIHFEKLRWPDGPVCHHCGVVGEATELQGKSTRPGLYKCRACQKPFTATMGTLYERSHIPLNKWLLATHLLCSSKKGISVHQLWRMLGFGSYRTAWFMAHRIREGMRDLFPESGPLGGEGKTVEIDETYVGGTEANKHSAKKLRAGRGTVGKVAVLGMRERGGRTRAKPVKDTGAKSLHTAVHEHVESGSTLHTDEHGGYVGLDGIFYKHERINHGAGEYVRDGVSTNSIESVWAVLKRGLHGTYHHASAKHLARYVNEFTFRLNDGDVKRHTMDRLASLVTASVGPRLTYKELIA